MRTIFWPILGAGMLISPAAAQEKSFARVVQCEGDAGRAEVYLPGSAITSKGRAEVQLGSKTVTGYLAFDFTKVGKNKTLEAVRIRLDPSKNALIVALTERGSRRAAIPLQGGKVAFPQRLAEEMTCKPVRVE